MRRQINDTLSELSFSLLSVISFIVLLYCTYSVLFKQISFLNIVEATVFILVFALLFYININDFIVEYDTIYLYRRRKYSKQEIKIALDDLVSISGKFNFFKRDSGRINTYRIEYKKQSKVDSFDFDVRLPFFKEDMRINEFRDYVKSINPDFKTYL